MIDMDVQQDIDHMMSQYPPLVNDRHHIKITVENGTVIVSGHCKTGITQRYLLNLLENLAGVETVNASGLYNDESLRLNIGAVIPAGVIVNIEYGGVILTGQLPASASVEQITARVEQTPGVRAVHQRMKYHSSL